MSPRYSCSQLQRSTATPTLVTEGGRPPSSSSSRGGQGRALAFMCIFACARFRSSRPCPHALTQSCLFPGQALRTGTTGSGASRLPARLRQGQLPPAQASPSLCWCLADLPSTTLTIRCILLPNPATFLYKIPKFSNELRTTVPESHPLHIDLNHNLSTSRWTSQCPARPTPSAPPPRLSPSAIHCACPHPPNPLFFSLSQTSCRPQSHAPPFRSSRILWIEERCAFALRVCPARLTCALDLPQLHAQLS